MPHRGRFATVMSILWSGPQFPFLSRHLRPEDAHRENPRQASRSDAALAILIVVAGALAVILVTVLVYAALMAPFH